jgi:hypothetical protein
MKFSWLLPAMLGGGVPGNLDKAGIAVSNKVSGYERRVLLGKGMWTRLQNTQQKSSAGPKLIDTQESHIN